MDLHVTDLLLLQKERKLFVKFSNGEQFSFPCEYLRVFSPSAEVRDHSGNINWPEHKENVEITAIEPVGLYAVKLHFDDGHHSGIYTFEYFYELMRDYEKNWRVYKAR